MSAMVKSTPLRLRFIASHRKSLSLYTQHSRVVSDWLPIVTWKSPSLIQKFDQVQVEQAALKQIARQKIEQNIQELQLEDSETF